MSKLRKAHVVNNNYYYLADLVLINRHYEDLMTRGIKGDNSDHLTF